MLSFFKERGILMAKLVINPLKKISRVNPEIYGHFSEHLGRGIYEGIYVGEDSPISNENGMRTDVVQALREIRIPVLRWPGGCFADEYHWKDGIGSKETRKKMINTHWGGCVEDNSFGTHEYFELCRQLGCKTYINGNLGSGTVQEMSEWVEYMTFDGLSPMALLREANGRKESWAVDYFGVGNENWGCGGNMIPEYYGNEYRRYQTYVRDYKKNKKIQKIACGANVDDYEWTENVLKTCFAHAPEFLHGFMNGLSLHYYVHPEGWEKKGSALEFDDKTWYKTLSKALYMEELICRHGAIMERFDPAGKIGMIVDEWGTWYQEEPGTIPGFLYQQNTMRDALAAAVTLNIFNKNSRRVRMANLAQMVNVLQAVILTEGKDMVLTPTYHVFHMYQNHQGAELVESSLETEKIGLENEYMVPNLSESVTVDEKGILHLTLANLSLTKPYDIETMIRNHPVSEAFGEIMTEQSHAANTFELPDRVGRKTYEGIHITKSGIHFTIPPCSVLHIAVK